MKQRNLGLDIIRSTAIIMVLISHRKIITGTDSFLFRPFGFIGVEIFFVLSGFLIGGIIIKDLLLNKSFPSLINFYLRRWFRTMPLYYLVVFLFILLGKPSNWESIFFLQNFNEQNLNFFPVSWSLSVEEWFYLLVPVLFLVASRLFNNTKSLYFTITISVIIVELFVRIYFVYNFNPNPDFGVRKQIFLRFDSLMIGCLFAGIKFYYNDFYSKLAKFNLTMLSTFVVGTVLLFYTSQEFYSFFGSTLRYALFSALVGLLIIVLEQSNLINIRLSKTVLSKIFTQISLLSYGLYLIHYDIYSFFAKFSNSYSVCLIAILTSFITAFILRKFCEEPFLKLRDKITLPTLNNFQHTTYKVN